MAKTQPPTAAAIKALGEERAWQRILYYVPRWTGSYTGLVDTPGFYLAPDGESDPVAELNATLQAFAVPVSELKNPDDHALCRFPLRRHFLFERLKLELKDFPAVTCKAYEDWRAAFPVTGASLVFSSNYLNNPSSMYGHTFLRLHRQTINLSDASPLLDYAVNFAANPTTENPLFYAVEGLIGRFFGTFSLMPYYLKVQEYNNAESRDLWEFPLKLSAAETDALMATLWEVGPHGIRYWYFDENCSFVLLASIAAARPEVTAVDHFPNVVSPKDTITELLPFDILGPPVRRLSALSRFVARRQDLNEVEQSLLSRQVATATLLPDIGKLTPERQVKILDALADWIAFREKLAGSNVASEHKALWDETLKVRAALALPSKPLVGEIDIAGRPEVGHPAQRVMLGWRGDRLQTSAHFGYRFTLHDTQSPPTGYSADQEITMGEFDGSLQRSQNDKQSRWRLLPERATIIRILSAPVFDSQLRSVAWTLAFGGDRAYGRDGTSWMQYHLEGGAGAAIALGSRSKFYVIPVLNIGRLKSAVRFDGAAGLRSGWLWDATPQMRTGIMSEMDVTAGKDAYKSWAQKLFVSYDVSSRHEIRLTGMRQAYRAANMMFNYYYYF